MSSTDKPLPNDMTGQGSAAPVIYKISERAPEFVESVTWIWSTGDGGFWWRATQRELAEMIPNPHLSHWCHSKDRPTVAPTAAPAPSREPSDTEMLDWLQANCEVMVSTNVDGTDLFGFNALLNPGDNIRKRARAAMKGTTP